MREMTSEEAAWVAGLLEGQTRFVRIDDLGVRVQLLAKDEELLTRLHEVTGLGTVSGPFLEEFARDEPEKYWRFVAGQEAELLKLFGALRDYLGGRAAEEIERASAAIRQELG